MRSIGVEPICEVDKQAIAFINAKYDWARPLVTSELYVSGCQPIRGDYRNYIALEGEHHSARIKRAVAVVRYYLIESYDVGRDCGSTGRHSRYSYRRSIGRRRCLHRC